MTHEVKNALDAAKEITAAAVGNAEIPLNAESGENVAAFFKAVYECVSDIANSAEQ